MILMFLILPGLFAAFWENLLFLLERKASTLPIPYPWPWRVDYSSVTVFESARQVLIGLFFISIAVFGLYAVAWIFFQKIRGKDVSPAFAAAAFMALPYFHHAQSRADIAHLAQSIFPVLIGFTVLCSTQPPARKWLCSIALCLMSIWVMHVHHPAWHCQYKDQCVNVEISQSTLLVRPHVARDIMILRNLADKYAPEGQSFIAAPFWPGAYALLERKSPMWEIYALHERSSAFEETEIARIKESKPTFAVILDQPLDGREELHFQNTRPLTYQFIQNNFDLVPDSPRPGLQIYKAKEVEMR
jgi:hypothetical protein